MTPPMGQRRRYGRDGEHGQMIVIFTLALIAIIAMAGLLIDGGMAWSNRRQAQAAADTAALAAAKAIVTGKPVQEAALVVAKLNQFGLDTKDCSGATLSGNAGPGVQVNQPPLSGAHTTANDPAHANDYVEVLTSRRMSTTFSGAIGLGCFMVSARAVSSIGTKSVVSCSFCSLAATGNHTILLDNGAALRVDGDIYVNSDNGGHTPGTCVISAWEVCGDGFDVFSSKNTIDTTYLSAQTISTYGGWETHDTNIATADHLAGNPFPDGPPCAEHPDPLEYVPLGIVSNVCIHMPRLPDPLADFAAPSIGNPPAANTLGCGAVGTFTPSPGKSGIPKVLSINSGTATICPGTYYGGISIGGSASVTMVGGVYYMAGGGFKVFGGGGVNGIAGVMIYNASGTVGTLENTSPGKDLIPKGDKQHENPKIDKKGGLTSVPNKNADLFQDVVFTFEIEAKDKNSPLPTGKMTFFDGSTPIPGCADLTPLLPGSNALAVKQQCTQQWSTFGTKSIAAVYYGDTTYNAIGDSLSIKIDTPPASPIAPVDIDTNGNVVLHGLGSGPYGGLTIFQDRTSDLELTLNPGPNSTTACGGDFMTVGVPDGKAPAACGALGGIQGTIYAPNLAARVYTTASGLTNLQIIAGKIKIDNDASARFAYTPEFFANGRIRLVE